MNVERMIVAGRDRNHAPVVSGVSLTAFIISKPERFTRELQRGEQSCAVHEWLFTSKALKGRPREFNCSTTSPAARAAHAKRHSGIDKNWQRQRNTPGGFVESHKLRLPARARKAGTSIAKVTGVALKKLRDDWGNGGSAGYRKTERSDRQSNK